MAELTVRQEKPARLQPIPARTQLLAVAWLRWRIFVNAFRRPTGTRQVIAVLI